jgi:hypothetical protein
MLLSYRQNLISSTRIMKRVMMKEWFWVMPKILLKMMWAVKWSQMILLQMML